MGFDPLRALAQDLQARNPDPNRKEPEMQQTRHTAEVLRFIVAAPNGLLELRITIRVAALIHHHPICDGESCGDNCDAELCDGDEISLAWDAASYDETVIWRGLAERAMAQEIYAIPQPPREPSAAARSFAATARRVADQMAAEGYFQP